MRIKSIRHLWFYLKRNSNFSGKTINSIIFALGYHPQNEKEGELKELLLILKDCAERGANNNFSGFKSYKDTIRFFEKHRKDIISHMEQTAAELGTDIISMVQNFGLFRSFMVKPTASEIGKALWDTGNYYPELNELYNVFTWYALEEVSHTWYRYIEENPAIWEKLSA